MAFKKKLAAVSLVFALNSTHGIYEPTYYTSYLPLTVRPSICKDYKSSSANAVWYMYRILTDPESIWYKDGITGSSVVYGYKECLKSLASVARTFDVTKGDRTGAEKYLFDINKGLLSPDKNSGIGQIIAAVAAYIQADMPADINHFPQIKLNNGKTMNIAQAVSFFVKLFREDGALKTSLELQKIYTDAFGGGRLAAAAASASRAMQNVWKEGDPYHPPSIKKAMEAEQRAMERGPRSPSPTRQRAAAARAKNRDDIRKKYNL